VSDPERREQREDAFDRAVDRHFSIFYRDPTLWPVLVVAVAAALCLGGSALVFAVRERNPYSIAALLVLAWLSADVVQRDLRRRRFGVASRAIAGLWLGAAGTALLASRLGIF
jgi:hypothetical protein